MNRFDVIQKIISRKKKVVYLEIGVFKGHVFLKIRARRKLAVDPEIQINKLKKLRYLLKNPYNLGNTYFEMTSDLFFEKHAPAVLADDTDVAFIDGLHTYEQAYKDVVNCLRYLQAEGVIIMHDCNPPNAAAAQRAASVSEAAGLQHPEWTYDWTGDVYKALLHLRAEYADLHIFVVDCDFGLGIITRGIAAAPLNLTPEQIAGMTYQDLARNRENLLNLKSLDYFEKWVGRI